MASVVTQELFNPSRNFGALCSPLTFIIRSTSCTPKKKPVRGTIKYRNLIESNCESLASRGFLRFQKSYEPTPDAADKVTSLVHKYLGSEIKLPDVIPKNYKFSILAECFTELKYSIPNSKLHSIITVQDLLDFYTTPVNTRTPYEELQRQELPPNLHIMNDYVRFDPETDTKFDGISAFPGSPTVIPSIKNRKKYKGTSCDLPMNYYNKAFYKP